MMQLRLVRKVREADDIVTCELVSADGSALPAFTAGSHVDVTLPGGLVRQYSLCNPPWERDRYLLGVLRAPDSRGGSIAMHDALAEGALVQIGEPRNLFPLVDSGPVLLFAGGIGVTPLICMAEALHAAGRPFELHYCTRSAARTAFARRLAESPFAASVHLHVDDGPATQRLDLAQVLARAAAGTHLYVCGPSGFIDFVTSFAHGAGWPREQVHVEFFTPPDNVAAAGTQQSFVVELAKSGQRFEIPADRSITDVLLEAGVDIAVSCEQGVCGTCLTRVLAGIPEHHDVFLTDDERGRNDQMTPCCSRACSDLLVLDL